MPHILIVCTANICRSPVGEAILRKRLHARGLTDWQVSSAGTWALEGAGAAQHSREIAQEWEGVDITRHRARTITAEMLAAADLALCMASNHVEALRAEFPHQASKIHLIAAMSGMGYDVADPYGGPRRAYEHMVAELTQLIGEGLPRIIELAQTQP